jgi:flagellar biogenesis protein FliO
MLGGLLLCLALLAAGLKVYQRFNPTATVGRARRLEVKERVAISSKASLTLVSLDGREFLVASGSEAVSVIPTRTKADDVFDQSLAEIYKEGEVCDAQ